MNKEFKNGRRCFFQKVTFKHIKLYLTEYEQTHTTLLMVILHDNYHKVITVKMSLPMP